MPEVASPLLVRAPTVDFPRRTTPTLPNKAITAGGTVGKPTLPALPLSYDRSDLYSNKIFQRFRDARITKPVALAKVDEW